jgi:hypothetical protein
VATVFVSGASPGICDSIVVSSENQNYTIGESLKDDAVIALGAQETLRVMSSDSGETRVINGPYKGKISAYTPACAGVLACERSKKELSIGATRALNVTNP